jgi:site-specific recombinase XerD
MYGCGLRVSEVAQVRLDDLRPEPNAILINGKDGPYAKNAKHRMVPLNPKSRGALDTYLVERERVANANKTKTRALFFRVRGKFADTKGAGGTLPINVLSIAPMLLHITKLRGLPADAPAPSASRMRDPHSGQRLPLDVISHILGHDNIDVTAYYAQVSTQLMTTYNQAHPDAKPMTNE